MSPLAGWGPALRIARRDALRSRARSLLVLLMIALPVVAVTAAAVVLRTQEVSGLEGADRRMGAADARVWTEGRGAVVQAPDPETWAWMPLGRLDRRHPITAADLRAVLGEDARVVSIRESYRQVRVGDRVVDLEATEVDLRDPLTRGLATLTAGRLPAAADEVVVNDALLGKGLEIGDVLQVTGADGPAPTIVGIVRDGQYRDFPVAIGPARSLIRGPVDETTKAEWLVDSGPVTWEQVRSLNARGGIVASRAVLADPPEVEAQAEALGHDTGAGEMLAIVALVVVMALIEVALLAGPAFAVGARRQSRILALVAASGGTPAQARRIVLASGIVLGSVAAGVGVVLGVAVGRVAVPVVQRFDTSWFGPFEVPWAVLAGVAGFGLLSAVLAAAVPAWIASRQDVVAVLAGRRGDRRPSAASPLLGVVLLAVGIAASSYGAVESDNMNGAYWIAGAAIVSVLGMILVVPLVVSLLARVASRMPLSVRYAARDAARHRTRTVPAVAAVAATVAGVVALGIATASDEQQNEATYSLQLPLGTGSVQLWFDDAEAAPGAGALRRTWSRVETAAAGVLGAEQVHRVLGVPENLPGGGYRDVSARLPGGSREPLLWSYSSSLGSSVLVSDRVPPVLQLDEEAGATAAAALGEGRVVVLVDRPVSADRVRLDVVEQRTRRARGRQEATAELPAAYVEVSGTASARLVLPTTVAAELGEITETVGLAISGEVTPTQETAVEEAVAGVAEGASVYVERGYERPAQALITLLVLGTLGGVLMLGGTLTATFLALSDARPDLATLSAVGAAPRTRRGVAAAYAVVVGFVGAVLGAAVGFIPGVAISRPLTTLDPRTLGQDAAGPFLDVPWLLIGALVVALPLLTAVVVGLGARSRLPLVARLD